MTTTEFEGVLRGVEYSLERLGQEICGKDGGCSSWTAINNAIQDVREAINKAYLMGY